LFECSWFELQLRRFGLATDAAQQWQGPEDSLVCKVVPHPASCELGGDV
jgi:hypothetical protein